MRTIIILVSIACAALIGLAVFFSMRSTSDAARIIPFAEAYTQRTEVGGWVKGDANAVVTIEEYGDMQCPACAAFQPILAEALAKTSDYSKLVFRHYPLPQHSKARLAAQGIEAAGRQGKFFQLQDSLYSSQDSWTNITLSAFRQEIIDRAAALGINMDQFRADLSSNGVNSDVDKDITKGNQIPIEATPTLIINGRKLSTAEYPRTADDFVKILAQARAEVTTATGTPQPVAQ